MCYICLTHINNQTITLFAYFVWNTRKTIVYFKMYLLFTNMLLCYNVHRHPFAFSFTRINFQNTLQFSLYIFRLQFKDIRRSLSIPIYPSYQLYTSYHSVIVITQSCHHTNNRTKKLHPVTYVRLNKLRNT